MEEPAQSLPGCTGRIRYGTHLALEEAADAILYDHLRTITSREEKSDILTTWKLKNRIGREVYTASGFPDSSVRSGMFHRVLNRAKPHLNSRDGLARATARSEHSIALREHLAGGGGDA
jgi:hypothetical protein